jgi:hypothetical protein
MWRITILGLLWFIASSVLWEPAPAPRGIFGVRISFQSNSLLTTYVCYIDNGRSYAYKKILTEKEFIYYASGKWPSIYNPEKRNLFEERNLSCGIYTDSFSNKETEYCIPLDSLWKIRFSSYPFRPSNEMGWSPRLMRPSEKQELYLYQNYGVRNVDIDFFVDSAFWQLLSDVQDTMWIANYKSLR